MPRPHKPPALRPGDAVRVLSVSSPVQENRLHRGCDEIVRLGYKPSINPEAVLDHESFFAGSVADRLNALKEAIYEPETRGIFCVRGGYGSTYLLDGLSVSLTKPKLLVGFSDCTALQIYLWEKFHWVTVYGPMVAAGLDLGPGVPDGYDVETFTQAISGTEQTWTVNLEGEALINGIAEGVLLGGCLTLIETTLGTPWELDTRGAVLLLEDVAMEPYQVDRSLMHLKQAGKFRGVAGIILGDFPECDPLPGSASVQEIAARIFEPLGIPVVWGAAVGHTKRPMRTLPLGIRVRLSSTGSTLLEILEPACIP